MTGSTRRQSSRVARVLGSSGVALLLLGAGCSSETQGGNPHISADADRSSTGVLEAVEVDGRSFTPNGMVRVTVLMAASGPIGTPYHEEDVQATADGKLRYERRPLPCPTNTDYGTGSWINVVARDMTTGISGSDALEPGREPDCRA